MIRLIKEQRYKNKMDYNTAFFKCKRLDFHKPRRTSKFKLIQKPYKNSTNFES